MAVSFEPTIAGAVLAAGAVAAGAPLFNAGLRALRLSRALARLDERPLAEHPSGFARVRGRVALESPLFAPLSGVPCAGFELEVRREGRERVAVLEERRAFRIVADGISARVSGGRQRWRVTETAGRELAAGVRASQHVESLLERAPEALRLRRAGETLRLVERALRPGVDCHVIGEIHQSRPLEVADAAGTAWLRTGTDDEPATVAAAPAPPDLWVDEGGMLDFLLVSDAPIERPHLAWSGLRALGLAAGPLLSLGGLLYLAHAADRLRELGRL